MDFSLKINNNGFDITQNFCRGQCKINMVTVYCVIVHEIKDFHVQKIMHTICTFEPKLLTQRMGRIKVLGTQRVKIKKKNSLVNLKLNNEFYIFKIAYS